MDKLRIRKCIRIGAFIQVIGGVEYRKQAISNDVDGETRIVSWRTTKVVENETEFKAACALRSRLGNSLRSLGADVGPLGLVVAMEREQELMEALERGKAEAKAFRAVTCKVNFGAFPVAIEPAAEEAAEAIEAEIGTMVRELKAAVETADTKEIRRLLKVNRGLDTLLPDGASQTVKAAMDAARTAARVIQREVLKKGREIEDVRKELDLSAFDEARFEVLSEPAIVNTEEEAPLGNMDRFDVESAPDSIAAAEVVFD